MIVVGARHHVLGVGEGRHPLAVLEPRVPADVVDMQVRAHHEVDLLGLHARLAQTVEIPGVQPVEARHARRGLWLPLQGRSAPCTCRCAPARNGSRRAPARSPAGNSSAPAGATGGEGLGVELGKEILGRKTRPHLLLDARDANVADVTVLHVWLPSAVQDWFFFFTSGSTPRIPMNQTITHSARLARRHLEVTIGKLRIPSDDPSRYFADGDQAHDDGLLGAQIGHGSRCFDSPSTKTDSIVSGLLQMTDVIRKPRSNHKGLASSRTRARMRFRANLRRPDIDAHARRGLQLVLKSAQI